MAEQAEPLVDAPAELPVDEADASEEEVEEVEELEEAQLSMLNESENR